MSPYLALIDPAEFGLIADYLRSPRAPINYLLHVNWRPMLAALAEQLDFDQNGDYPVRTALRAITRGFRDGSLLISSRHSLDLKNPNVNVDTTTIPRHASCEVIYLPPYYLVHTPGLFEGTLIRREIGNDPKLTNPRVPKPRVKL